jgi:hypothetical protein
MYSESGNNIFGVPDQEISCPALVEMAIAAWSRSCRVESSVQRGKDSGENGRALLLHVAVASLWRLANSDWPSWRVLSERTVVQQGLTF